MTALASIDLGAIRRNVARLSALAPKAISCAVVKADGYGHGAARVAEAALASLQAMAGAISSRVMQIGIGRPVHSTKDSILWLFDGLATNGHPARAAA